MSGIGKAIGKVFKKVVKVVKRIALPVLAIGAVVLTGGAALGLLPSIGAIGSSLGLSAGLTSVLSTAATSATFGAGAALVMGKNPIKGATMGLVTGGILGGLGAALGGTAGAAGSAASSGLNTAGQISNTFTAPITGAGAAAPSMGMDSLVQAGKAAVGGLGGAASSMLPAATALPTVAAPVASASLAPAASTATTAAQGGGFMGFLNRNPPMAGMALQGLGSGLMAREQAKEEKRVRNSYNDLSSLFSLPDDEDNQGDALPGAGAYYRDAIYGKLGIAGNRVVKGN